MSLIAASVLGIFFHHIHNCFISLFLVVLERALDAAANWRDLELLLLLPLLLVRWDYFQNHYHLCAQTIFLSSYEIDLPTQTTQSVNAVMPGAGNRYRAAGRVHNYG